MRMAAWISTSITLMAIWAAPQARAVVGGNTVGTENRIAQSTVKLETSFDGYILSRCSGTLIQNQIIVTAAHCVDRDPDRILIRFADGTRRNAEAMEIHPEYEPGIVHADLALIHFTGHLPEGHRPMAILQSASRFHEAMLFDFPIWIAGYGLSQHAPEWFGQLRVTQLRLGDSFHDTITLESPLTNLDRPAPSAAPGDSGGPAMIQIGGEYLLWGVASFIDPSRIRDPRAQNRSYFTLLTTYRDWIATASERLRH